MFKTVIPAVIALGLIAAPLTSLAQSPPSTPSTTQDEPVKKPVKKKSKEKKELTAGQKAERERIKKCGAEWKEAKAAGKIEKGMKWPKYWSACNKRLKAET